MHVRILTTTTGAALCALCVLALSAPSPAEAYDARDTVIVRAHDLDLSTDVGAQRLLRRLDHAVERVCGGAVLQQFAVARRAYRRCYESTMSETLAELDAPRVRAHYAQRLARRAETRRGRSS